MSDQDLNRPETINEYIDLLCAVQRNAKEHRVSCHRGLERLDTSFGMILGPYGDTFIGCAIADDRLPSRVFNLVRQAVEIVRPPFVVAIEECMISDRVIPGGWTHAIEVNLLSAPELGGRLITTIMPYKYFEPQGVRWLGRVSPHPSSTDRAAHVTIDAIRAGYAGTVVRSSMTSVHYLSRVTEAVWGGEPEELAALGLPVGVSG